MDVFRLIEENFPTVEKERGFSFAKHTCIGSGGRAAIAISPIDIEEAANCLNFLERNQISYCFLGAGANVLPRDGEYEGVVVRFDRMKKLALSDRLYAGAGVTGGKLLSFAENNSVTGFEPFAGIPTTVGGGVAMNAGIDEKHFSDMVISVIAYCDGVVKSYAKDECLFSLKNSIFLKGIAILGVYFKAEKAAREKIKERTAFYLERRKHLPKGRSMGCTFVNPEGISAGALIDSCGLKGKRVGCARVSEEHANFIINEGTSSEDVARLIDEVKEEVYLRSGIRLREEIRRIP